ncbi:PAC2 family protein, partial [uncultured Amnibacterium sp.]|uniref:PAC2 family protein n=1 Tax=uncultured Amnibacterium sp. TaxID=1631851 RepID=UPI0035CA3C93
MRAPEDLYELTPEAEQVPQGLPLVAGLTGFADAGSAVQQLGEYFADTSAPVPVAVFDDDELLDYRARRPVIDFDEDHIASFTPLSLVLSLCRDDIGRPFLLLSGYEPDFQWNRFAAAVISLIDRFGVTSTTWVQSIPMPVPHTRPLQVTVGGTRQDLIDSMSAWRPTTR